MLVTVLNASDKRRLKHSALEEGKKDLPAVTMAAREVCLQQRNTSLKHSRCFASLIGRTLSMGHGNKRDT